MSVPARELSQRLFKAQYRLEVGAAISRRAAAGEGFSQKDIADELGDPPGKGGVSKEVATLRKSGLVKRAREDGSERTRPLVAVASPYWEMCQQLADQAAAYLGDAEQ
jgi:hypothetical protein